MARLAALATIVIAWQGIRMMFSGEGLGDQMFDFAKLLLFVAFFRKTQKVSRTDRRWLRFHLFASENPGAFQAENLRGRYLEATELAASYTQFLDTLNGMRRLDEIRMFRSLDYGAKKERILALPGKKIAGLLK